MITIQKVSEALHEIETQVFKDLEVNPFRQDPKMLLDNACNVLLPIQYKDIPTPEFKEQIIRATALFTRLISELP